MAFNFKNFFTKFRDRYESLKSWDYRSRNYYLMSPPYSPSGEDIRFYREQVSDASVLGPGLVLGVTPQLRVILSDILESVILADFSRKMYLSTLKRVKPEVLDKETFLWANWLNLARALGLDSIDLVVGDLVLMQIGPHDREMFLDNIFRILKPGGFFISRVKIHNPFWRNVSPYDIARGLFKKSEPLQKYILHRFGDKILDEKNFSFKIDDILPLFTEAFNDSRDAKERESILSAMRYFEKTDDNMVRSYFPKTFFDSWISEKFDIVKISRSGDYEESEFYPIYTLRKK